MEQDRHKISFEYQLGRSKLYLLCNGERLYFKPMAINHDHQGTQILEGYDTEMAYIHIPLNSIVSAV